MLSNFPPLMRPVAMALLLAGCQTTEPTKPEPKPVPLPGSEEAPVASNASDISPQQDAAGWVTTASGLRYKVLQSGSPEGNSPTRLDVVTVHYRGTLTNGTVFDSSVERGTPATFAVAQVIPGWTEALQLMKPGDQWVLYIPSHLAYGPRAVGAIPPHSDLIFQVALLQVQ
jgi:FKBP-type peptidyl-prolyl cis-trans isomerase FklB